MDLTFFEWLSAIDPNGDLTGFMPSSLTQQMALTILQHASRVISDWIHFYNHRRPHQALAMKTPAQTYQSFKLAA